MSYRRALVVGLGKSGAAACRLLRAIGVEVAGYDRREIEVEGVEVFGGDEPPPEAFAGIDLMVLSPGVPPRRARELCPAGVAIHGELGLALILLHRLPRLVLITGTNGKSTVTELLGQLLAAGGRSAFVGGNLGSPPADMTREILAGEREYPEFLVLECSSYQLETLPVLRTEAALLLNVTPDHLDRYASMEDYARTKAKIFRGLHKDGLALLSAADEWTPLLAPANAKLVGSGSASVEGEALVVGDDPPYPRSLLRLAGRHNATNALFALTAARFLGVSSEDCRVGLRSFEGLPHRMVFVREVAGVKYFNDSKATNVASAVASVGGLTEPFVLIAGGISKGDDLEPLAALVRERARGIVAIGRDAPSFLALAPDKSHAAADMIQAVAKAVALAQPGDVVVLAPACASFDQYRSFAHRGDTFTAAVEAL